MDSNAISQLLFETNWGDIDYMIIDFPPGTGDVQITSVQKLMISGAIIVTTPQQVALNAARKGAEMFVNPNIDVPLLGVVENMSWFTPLQHPDEKYYLYGKDGGLSLANQFNTDLLSQIPFMIEVGEVADHGMDYNKINNEQINIIFSQLVERIVMILSSK